MAAGRCTLELYVDGRWKVAGEIRCDDVSGGVRSPTRFENDFDYLDGLSDALGARDHRAVSCRFPVGYGVHAEETWPPFLLDVIPSGAARRFWETTLALPNTKSSDWAILVAGGGNAPGNLRVAEAALELAREPAAHAGFSRDDILERADGFIEYARSKGASVAGGSGAAGDAPKFLLREDDKGRWHADGALSDERTAACWIVKFPRSPRAADRLVLEAEAPYYQVAEKVGVRVAGPLAWEKDCLFVPRFDRPRIVERAKMDRGKTRKRVRLARLGMESLCSLAGVSDFGPAIPKESLAGAVARFTSKPDVELKELLLRDVLDVALGNTDNHARNTAVLKHESGLIELAPLYDFAPMVLDPQGIARVCRWQAEEAGYPIWSRVAEALGPLGLDVGATKAWLREMAGVVGELPKTMSDAGVPRRVVQTLDARIARVARALEGVRR